MAFNPKMTVLVVDDDPDLRDAIRTFLEAMGYRTIACSNGREGIEAFKKNRPNIVITDYAMPDVNGEQMIEEIRQIDPSAPFLLMTGNLSDSMMVAFLRFDRFFALHKPFQSKALAKTIEQILKLPPLSGTPSARKAYRLEVKVPVAIQFYGTGKTGNLSVLGAYIETSSVIPVGTEIKMTFDMGEPVFVTGSVIWNKEKVGVSGPRPGIGVKFKDLADDSKNKLTSFLINALKASGQHNLVE